MRHLKSIGLMLVAIATIFAMTACFESPETESPVLESIEITAQPAKTEYVIGQEFDPAGMVVTAKYSDDSVKVVTDYTYAPDGPLAADDDEITVTYQGKTATVEITVLPVALQGIAVTKAPTKTTYKLGETFSATGMEVTATYTDGSTEKVTGFTFSPGTPLTVNDNTITVTYQGKTATVEINVITLQSIAVTKQPTKAAYKEGQVFEPAGMEVTATYSDGSTEEVVAYDYSPKTALNLNDTVTVTYQGKTANVNISYITVASIAVTQQPDKTDYGAGENFDPTGMVVTATFTDGSTEIVTGYTISPSENLSVSDTQVTITYKGKSTTVAITVIDLEALSIETEPNKMIYFAGQTFNPAGMVLLAVYTDSSTLELTEFDWEPAGVLTVDDTIITFTYAEKTVTLEIEVYTLKGIEITTPPATTVYYEGETFDTTGMVVTATIEEDDSTFTVTDYTVEPDRALNVDDSEVSISLLDKTATIEVTVFPPKPVGTPISTPEQFLNINNNLSGSYYLTNDIDFGGATIDRIGHIDKPGFKGVFDGRGYAIRNFVLGGGIPNTNGTAAGEYGRALFACIETGAVVKNLAIIDGNTQGFATSLLVGELHGLIENCYVEGNLNNNRETTTNHWQNGGTVYGRTEGDSDKTGGTARNIVTKVTTTKAGTLAVGGRTAVALTNLSNIFVVSDGIYSLNPGHMIQQGGSTTYIPTPGATVFSMVDINTVDFSTLHPAYWNFVEGELPTLKRLDPALVSIEVTTEPDKTEYYEGNTFDTTGMVVTAHFDDESSQEVIGYKVSPEVLTADTTKVTVTYWNKSVTLDVTVNEITEEVVDSITIAELPEKTEYIEGEDFEADGMVVIANLTDGTTAIVSDYTVTPDVNIALEDTKVTVSFKGKTAEVDITVTAKSLLSLNLKTFPDTIEYSEGETFDPTGMTLSATYDNGKTETITAEDITVPTEPMTGVEEFVVVSFGGKDVMVPLKTVVPASDEGFGGYDHASGIKDENNKIINFFNPDEWKNFPGQGATADSKTGVAPVWNAEDKTLKFTTETTRLRFDWFREANPAAPDNLWSAPAGGSSSDNENAYDNISAGVRDHMDDIVMTYSLNIKTTGSFMLYLMVNNNCPIEFDNVTTGGQSCIRISYKDGKFVIDSPIGGPGVVLAEAAEEATTYEAGEFNRFDFSFTRKDNTVTLKLFINEVKVMFTSSQTNEVAGVANADGNFLYKAGKHDAENSSTGFINYGHRFAVVPSADLYFKAVD